MLRWRLLLINKAKQNSFMKLLPVRQVSASPYPAWSSRAGTSCPLRPGQRHRDLLPWLPQHRALGPGCCGEGEGTPTAPGGSPPCDVFYRVCRSLKASELLTVGIHPHLYFFFKGGERVPHLGGFYIWNLTKDFGPFLEAEVHGQRRKGRKGQT